MFCKNCGNILNDGQTVCTYCNAPAGQGQSFCANCGQVATPGAAVCTNCGAPVAPVAANNVSGAYLNGKDKTLMAVLAILLPGLGIHNFMMGETKKGIFKLVMSCFCLGWIFGLIDFFKILGGSYVVDPNALI